MVDKLDEMESKLNEQIDRNVALNRRLAESNADSVFAAVSEGLADTQKEKLATLAENVEFESDTDYREKLETCLLYTSPSPRDSLSSRRQRQMCIRDSHDSLYHFQTQRSRQE